MKELIIDAKDSGQRMDKYLKKYFCNAGSSFLYKMLRKKNIVLNGKKASGNELLKHGDVIGVFFSEETFAKFSSSNQAENIHDYTNAYRAISGVDVLYEDEDFLILFKPEGILTQKSSNEDISLNDWIIGYLIETGQKPDFNVFRPGAVNRIDRNTTGIVLGAKTYRGSRVFSDCIKDRSIRKFYLAVAEGKTPQNGHLAGYLVKNESENKVLVYDDLQLVPGNLKSAVPIETRFRTLDFREGYSLVEVELLTGKSHQIRAHLASVGHPLAGDVKYGGKKYPGSKGQALLAYRMEFPEGKEELGNLQGKAIAAKVPKGFWLTDDIK